jgi:hypothetical protein
MLEGTLTEEDIEEIDNMDWDEFISLMAEPING